MTFRAVRVSKLVSTTAVSAVSSSLRHSL